VDERERDPDIPPGRGYLGERLFEDRMFPPAGHERFRESWDAREVIIDAVISKVLYLGMDGGL